MLIWIIFAAMTGAAIFALLWPLSHGRVAAFTDTADAKSLYRAQLTEIDRDVGRKLMAPSEAQAARAEAARRLLRQAGEETLPAGETESSLRRRRASSALALSCVPLLALLVYGAYGSPGHPDQPLAARLQADPSTRDFALSLARIEAHLAANPQDSKGWAVIAPIYLRQGRFDDAVRAFEAMARFGQPDPDALAGLGEARTMAAGGVVTVQARDTLANAVTLDPKNARARFFLALGKEQDGDAQGAIAALHELLADAAPGADWVAGVRNRLAQMEGDAGRAAIAALPGQDREQAIRGMVEGLASRLRDSGGDLAEWSRLIRSQMVLGERDAARAALVMARERLAQDSAALAGLDRLADELRLKAETP